MDVLKNFQKVVRDKKWDGCLIENPIDLYYLTGLTFSEGSLVVTPKSARLFVDGRYTVMARGAGQVPVEERTVEKIGAFCKAKGVRKLVFDSGWTSFGRYEELKAVVGVKGTPTLLKESRGIKREDEVGKLRVSSELLWKGFCAIKRFLKVGVSEREVAKHFEIFCLKNGGERLGFDPIVAFGDHSAMPHHHVTDRKLKKDEVVLIDIGVVVGGYHSDMTRMVFCGRPKERWKEIYELVQGAQQEVLAMCRPGVTLGVLDEHVRKRFDEVGLLKYYPHGLGHGVGLEVHEWPRVSHKGADRDQVIEPGMVFTVEPGIYLPGEFGVRYEDTIVVTEEGVMNLYPVVPFESARKMIK